MIIWIQTYSDTKRSIAEYFGASEALLHLHAGLLIFFVSSLLFRRRMRSWVPIGLVYAFAVANEVVDLLTPDHQFIPLEPVVDVANTVVWPTLLFLLARRRIPSSR